MLTEIPLTESEFLANRRSKQLGYPRYEETASGAIETFQLVTSSLNDQERVARLAASRPMVAAEERAWASIDYLHVQYSAGVDLVRLNRTTPTTVDFWGEYATYHARFHASPESNGRRIPHIDLHDKDYWKAIRLTSFGLLLGHAELLPRIAALWDYENDEMDGLLERLVAPFVPGRAPPPDTCTRHLPYFKLLKVFAATPDKRPALMSRYMDEWYTASRREPYYESHTKGREHSFLGYWSFEAAAVSYLLDIDDSSFRDHEFYPKDMADHARGLPRPAAIGGVPTPGSGDGLPIRCLAGDPCPREGFWFTPARKDSRRHFAASEQMPEVGGSFGATIWQWDGAA